MFEFNVCNKVTGFYPGIGKGPSEYLNHLNLSNVREAQSTFAIYSREDPKTGEGTGGIIYGKNTCLYPTCDDSKDYGDQHFNHFDVRDKTLDTQYKLITER